MGEWNLVLLVSVRNSNTNTNCSRFQGQLFPLIGEILKSINHIESITPKEQSPRMLRTESWSKSGKKTRFFSPLIFSKESKSHPFFFFFYFVYSDRLTQDDKESKQKSGFKKHLNMFFKRNQFRSKGDFPLLIYSQPPALLQNNTRIQDTSSFYWSARLSAPCCDEMQSAVQL